MMTVTMSYRNIPKSEQATSRIRSSAGGEVTSNNSLNGSHGKDEY